MAALGMAALCWGAVHGHPGGQETLRALVLPTDTIKTPITPGAAFLNTKVLEDCATCVRPGKREKEVIFVFGACYFQILYYRELR